MATKRFTGYLREPLSEYAQHDLWRFTHATTTGEVVKGSTSIFKVDDTGYYDITIQYGTVMIESKDRLSQRWINHGQYTISSATTVTTLPALLLATTPMTPELQQELEAILADAQEASDLSVQAYQNIDQIIYDSTLQAIVNLSGGKWNLFRDNFGNIQIQFALPLTTYETLNIPDCPFTGPLDAFIRPNGTLRPNILVSVYIASSLGGKAVSQAGRNPFNRVNLDTARVRCTELGSGGRIAGRYVYAAILWMMISNNYQPRGNTEFGRSHSNINEFGRRADGRVPDDRAGEARTLTGTGPNTWNHDGTTFGIADLIGNVWEWEDDFKMLDGQFFVAEHLGQEESSWVATGVYINEQGQFSSAPPTTLNSGNQVWGNIPKAAGYAGDEKLQRLIIEPIECTKHLAGRFYWNLDGERFPHRGGAWNNASFAGPAALNCLSPRSDVFGTLGFRAAFVED